MKVKLPVTWEVCGMVEVEADSVAEAMDVFRETRDDIDLPCDWEYVDGSFDLTMYEADGIQKAYNPGVPIGNENE